MKIEGGGWTVPDGSYGSPPEGAPPSVDVRVEETALGTWRRYDYPSGARFAEFRSNAEVLGYPLLHYTSGIDPATRRRVVARGVVAVGRKAIGFLALGQVAMGVIAVGQGAAGVAVLGQAAGGVWSIGQLSLGCLFAAGQVAIGSTAIGQLALGRMAMGQIAVGAHSWMPGHADPVAVAFFKTMLNSLLHLFGG